YRVRFGTCASRSERSRTLSLSSASAVNAVTATGTSCRVSSRLRAVTLMLSRVVVFCPSAGAAGAAASCANTGTAVASTDTANAPRIAVLNCLRFIVPLLRVHGFGRAIAADAAHGRCSPAPAALDVRTMGRPAGRAETRNPDSAVLGGCRWI